MSPSIAPLLNRVLLVEDDPEIQMVAEMSLQSVGGFTVEVCGDGSRALARAPDFAPDLVLLDVMMPDMDGPTTLARLRELEPLARVPVIFMTAKAQGRDREYYLSLGAIGVVPKPFDPMGLPARLCELWDEHHAGNLSEEA